MAERSGDEDVEFLHLLADIEASGEMAFTGHMYRAQRLREIAGRLQELIDGEEN